MKRILVASVLCIFLFSSCHFLGGKRVGGDGNVVTQSRSVNNFSGVDVSGAIDIYLTQDSTYSVKVETDNNLQELIDVYADGDMLRIHSKDNYNLDPTGSIKVYVAAPVFRRLEASGACKIQSQTRVGSADKIDIGMSGACDVDLDLKTPEVILDASGACTAKLKGEAKSLRIQGSGSINVKAFDLMTETADIDISGAGSAEIFASQKIDASASGATDIRYKGNAAVNTNVSGAGSVKKVD